MAPPPTRAQEQVLKETVVFLEERQRRNRRNWWRRIRWRSRRQRYHCSDLHRRRFAVVPGNGVGAGEADHLEQDGELVASPPQSSSLSSPHAEVVGQEERRQELDMAENER